MADAIAQRKEFGKRQFKLFYQPATQVKRVAANFRRAFFDG